MAKRLVVLIGMLAVVLVAVAVPALAQEEEEEEEEEEEKEKGTSKAGEGPTKEEPVEKEPVEKEATRVKPTQVKPDEKPPEEAKRDAGTREEAAGEQYARAVEATGVLRAGLPEDVAANGSHSINDESSSTTYALRSESVDLDEYVGEQVIVYGVTVPGSGSPAEGGAEGRFGSGSLPLLEVYQVEPTDGPDGPPVYCAAIGCKPGDPITATFELTIEGEVPEGSVFEASLVKEGDIIFDTVRFCSTSKKVATDLPRCEDGETYSDTAKVPASSSIDFFYHRAQFDESGGPVTMQDVYSGSKAFTLGDDTVSATYRADGTVDPTVPPGEEIEATGVLERPAVTGYMYSHALTDEASGTYYRLGSDRLDLDAYVCRPVTIFGTPVTVEDGPVEDDSQILNVTRVEPKTGYENRCYDPEDYAILSFELTVEGEPPADAAFYGLAYQGYMGSRGDMEELKDPDGDGVYTGSVVMDTSDEVTVEIAQGSTIADKPGRRIQDFGTMSIEKDKTFSASVSFKGNKGGTTTPDPGNGGSNNGGSGGGIFDNGGSGGGSNNGVFGGTFLGSAGGIRGLLPSTGGGVALTTLGVGVLLIAGGLLARRAAR